MRELRRMLGASPGQAGWSGEAAIEASGFQRDQTSYHYHDRANYSWSGLREEWRSNSTRPLIKHQEQTPLQKIHNARMNEDCNPRWMSETGFSQLTEDDGEKLLSRSWHGQFRELTRKCIVYNLTHAVS